VIHDTSLVSDNHNLVSWFTVGNCDITLTVIYWDSDAPCLKEFVVVILT